MEKTLGFTFVALTRFKSISDFLIMPCTLERLQKLNTHPSLKPRLEEEKRIEGLVTKTKNFLKKKYKSNNPYL